VPGILVYKLDCTTEGHIMNDNTKSISISLSRNPPLV